MNLAKLQFVFAGPADEPSITALLGNCGLPHEDISNHLRHFIVAKSSNRIVGVVGLEVLGEFGLLRSLAVVSSYRGKGLAKTLCNKIEGYASSRGIKELYLLTLNAEGFFKKLDYHRVERTEVPEPVQNTQEFSSICPATSACMAKRIDKNLIKYLLFKL